MEDTTRSGHRGDGQIQADINPVSAEQKAEGQEADVQRADEKKDGEEKSNEEVKVRVLLSPKQPTAKEIEQHNASGHYPYRAWCPSCIRGRGRSNAHKSSSDEGICKLCMHSQPVLDPMQPCASLEICMQSQPPETACMCCCRHPAALCL